MKYANDIATLQDLMLLQLKGLYDTEMQWSSAMGELASKISSSELVRLFRESGQIAAKHARVIQNILKQFGENAVAPKNIIARDLIKEFDELCESAADDEVLNAGLIVSHQSMNHYKIVRYGSVASFARLLRMEKIATFLHEIMEEEKRDDKALTELAEEKINVKAKFVYLL
ncbi:DUF892 family protein [Ferruginibacter lapsinanis]|uniref:DUF892 family protein n=1 Tax=Ferruginibacter lapsinanis TaxID=563172 RepID=UPI001E4CE841|nr:DUF892 family protein [Ferruginibacter lapsinanis]UEG48858.1 DUF892 family protein [Ferruginibacter lapsinanis]